ncbi:MAG: hypothetical protein Q7J67_01495 [bacterium]|nr:hypothetical protein [bacterium]
MKDVNSLPGLHKLRTMFSAKKRSIPKVQSSGYLDLYMLGKEKERLLKEDERLDMRKDTLKKRLEEIDLEMNQLQEVSKSGIKSAPDIGFSGGTFTQKNGVKKEWKKMSLNY